MLLRWTRFPSFFLVAFLAFGPVLSRAAEISASPAQTAQRHLPHLIEGLGKDAVALDQRWQFRTGDDPSWSSPTLDDSQWQRISADGAWGTQGFPAYAGFAWYRYRLSIAPTAGSPREFALLIPGIDDAYELYWNGSLIGTNGKLPPHPEWFISQPSQTYGLGSIQNGVLAVRVWKAPLTSNDPDSLGGFEGVPLLGGPDALQPAKPKSTSVGCEGINSLSVSIRFTLSSVS